MGPAIRQILLLCVSVSKRWILRAGQESSKPRHRKGAEALSPQRVGSGSSTNPLDLRVTQRPWGLGPFWHLLLWAQGWPRWLRAQALWSGEAVWAASAVRWASAALLRGTQCSILSFFYLSIIFHPFPHPALHSVLDHPFPKNHVSKIAIYFEEQMPRAFKIKFY